MLLKNILDEDFVNYKRASMYLAFPFCSFKCEKECGIKCCHNSDLVNDKFISIDTDKIIERYIMNPITKAIICCGLEPLDSFSDVLDLLDKLRTKYHNEDDFVIYTGYYKEEILDKIEQLKQYPNVVIKFGRFIPNQPHKFDDVLQVTLASPNQYGEKIS